jgi:VWFA-related protein
MLHRVLVVLAAATALLPTGAGAGQPSPQTAIPTFRSATVVVSVTAVVRDRKGRFVRDLGRNDFVVAEEGKPRTIVDFRSESDGPVKLALLVDISGSMRVASRATEARDAARHLFGALRPADEAALYSFDTRLRRVHGFTSDVKALDAALDDVGRPYGQTSLYDAVAEMSKTFAVVPFEAEGRLPQRRAVVVLTDGIDTRSRLTSSEVSAIASAIDVPVYVVAVMSPIDNPPGDDRTDRQDSALDNLARWTGGALFIVTAPAHASVASRQIVDELRHQYVLAFEASTLGGWRPLEVRARNRDLIVRARAGYFASGNRS